MATLMRLKGIGKKKAEQIVSQLADEIAELGILAENPDAPAPAGSPARSSEAMAILVGQLGLRTAEAEELIGRAVSALGAEAEIPEILEEVFRLRR